MKRRILLPLFLLSAVLLLNSCAFLPAAVAVGVIAGLEDTDFSMEISDSMEEYSNGEITLTLPNDFWESDSDNCDLYLVSEYADIYAWKDEIGSDETPVPVEQYMDLFIQSNDLDTEPVVKGDSMVYCKAEREFYDEDGFAYYFIQWANDAYVIVAIAYFAEDAELVEPHVIDWAQSIEIKQ